METRSEAVVRGTREAGEGGGGDDPEAQRGSRSGERQSLQEAKTLEKDLKRSY